MKKLVIVAILLILLIFLSMDRKHVMVRFVYIKNISVTSVENALSEGGTTNYQIGPHRLETVPRIGLLHNGRLIKHVKEFA